MLSRNDFRAVIFDLDGLILDTEPSYFKAWARALTAMSYQNAQAFCETLCGMAYSSIVERIQENYGMDFDLIRFAELSENFWREHVYAEGIPVKYGFYGLIEVLKAYNIPYALATNSRSRNAHECLKLANLVQDFHSIVTRDDVQEAKPQPEIYLKTAALLNLNASECLVLEDSLPGITAAANAGTKVAYIPSTPVISEAVALSDYQFRDLFEVANCLSAD